VSSLCASHGLCSCTPATTGAKQSVQCAASLERTSAQAARVLVGIGLIAETVPSSFTRGGS
jgi:hypothetical protein